MKKKTLSIFAVLLALAVVAGTSAAKGPKSNHGHGKSKGYAAKQWRGPIMATVAGGTVAGRAKADQNKKFTQLKVHLRGLVAGASYTISLNEGSCAGTPTPTLATGATGATGSTGSTGTTGPTGTSDTSVVTKTVVANPDGNSNSKTKVSRSVLTLLTTNKYSVQVADSTGAIVACGDLVAKKKHK